MILIHPITAIIPAPMIAAQRENRITFLSNVGRPCLKLTPLQNLLEIRSQIQTYNDVRLYVFSSSLKREIRIKQILALKGKQVLDMNLKQLKQLIEEIEIKLKDQRLLNVLNAVRGYHQRSSKRNYFTQAIMNVCWPKLDSLFRNFQQSQQIQHQKRGSGRQKGHSQDSQQQEPLKN